MNVSINPSIQKVSFQYGTHTVTLETGLLAQQATAAITVHVEDTFVFVPLVAMQESNPDANFLPMSVHYQQKSYSRGKVPGNRFRREMSGAPTEAEILTSRLIDRTLRAIFPKGFYHEIQINPQVYSDDPNVINDIPALLGASAAVSLSGLPCRGPVAAARVGSNEKGFILNPNATEMTTSDLDLVISGTESSILMIEAEANELSPEEIMDAITFGHQNIQIPIKAILKLKQQVSSQEWKSVLPIALDSKVEEKVRSLLEASLESIYENKNKAARQKTRMQVQSDITNQLLKTHPEVTLQQLETLFKTIEAQYMKHRILEKDVRIDGRKTSTIRPIQIQTHVLPRAHGSAIFTRGETQALVVATLGTERDAQTVEGLDGEYKETFMLHYNFPPYSVGEVGRVGAPKRREIGHGNLAKRAMRAVLPDENACPHVIRVVSEIMSSNGSSSMATVCGTSLALMDAGIPLTRHVAGIAMGLVKHKDRFAILSDISADEDHIGDMDLKIAGTRKGITGLQMDIKTDGITKEILLAAIQQGYEGIQEILGIMEKSLSTPRSNISPYAPQIVNMQIPVDKIQTLIGKGGATIRMITAETGTLIDIHRETGLTRISSPDASACQKAIEYIKETIEDAPEVQLGMTYQGVVVKVIDAGAFISILPGRRGFIPVSEISKTHPDQEISAILQEEQSIMVKVDHIDYRRNRIKLSMQASEVEKELVVIEEE